MTGSSGSKPHAQSLWAIAVRRLYPSIRYSENNWAPLWAYKNTPFVRLSIILSNKWGAVLPAALFVN